MAHENEMNRLVEETPQLLEVAVATDHQIQFVQPEKWVKKIASHQSARPYVKVRPEECQIQRLQWETAKAYS